MTSPSQSPSVLVVGGCGFIGYHIVRHLIQDATFASVAVLSRSAAENKESHVQGAEYFSVDIADRNSLGKAFENIKPTTIIHASSPSPMTGSAKEFNTVTVEGTRNLLELATVSQHVRAFIYTSSNMVNRGREHIDAKEDHPLAINDPKASLYARAKATAEKMVLEANKLPESATDDGSWSGFLATGALRFPIVYGSHNSAAVSGCMNVLRKKETKVRVGDGKNFWSYCSSQNLVDSHLLLAQSLLGSKRSDVAGEAFNINDGEPHLFWGFVRDVWKTAGHENKKDLSVKIPVWSALATANFLEFAYRIFTFGRKRPGLMSLQQVEYCCFTHTYSIEKARVRLGFVPKQKYEVILGESVKWCQDEYNRTHNTQKSRR